MWRGGCRRGKGAPHTRGSKRVEYTAQAEREQAAVVAINLQENVQTLESLAAGLRGQVRKATNRRADMLHRRNRRIERLRVEAVAGKKMVRRTHGEAKKIKHAAQAEREQAAVVAIQLRDSVEELESLSAGLRGEVRKANRRQAILGAICTASGVLFGIVLKGMMERRE